VVGVDILGIPGKYRVGLPDSDSPGNLQSLFAAPREARIGEIKKLVLSPQNRRHISPVSLADLGHLGRRHIAKLAGEFAPCKPYNLGGIAA